MTRDVLRDVLEDLSADEAFEHIERITERAPERLAGSPALKWMAHYVKDALEDAGVPATVHEFEALVSFPGKATLHLLAPEAREFPALPFAHIPSTGPEGIEGEVVFVGPGNDKDYEGKDVRGKITLSELSYSPPRQEKERIGSTRGAIGHIMMNWGPSDSTTIAYGSVKSVWGNPTPETIGLMPSRPCITVARSTGEYLRDLSRRGPVRVRFTAEASEEWRDTQITVGQLKGSEEPDKVILIGGHMDAWGGGVSCNAVGNSAVLELARVLARHRKGLKRSIWFTLWSGHETGTMVGSTWFSDHFWDELDQSGIVYINVDSPGLVGATEYNTRSSSELLQFHRAVEAEALPGVHCRRVRLTRIGDMSFVGVGIPTLSPRSAYPEDRVKAWNGAELGPWHHSIEMTLETVEREVLQRDLRAYATMVTRLSNEPVLPYDFTPVVEEMDARLAAIAPKAPERLRLDAVQDRVRELRELVEQLNSSVAALRAKARWPLTRNVRTANAGLIRLARILNAPTSTVSGRWDQDLYGLSALRTVFPSLFPLETLAGLPPGDVSPRLLLTRLVRNRNWIADCVAEAVASARRTLAELT